MNFKNAFAVLRPHELSPQVQPMIPTPNHGSMPSGHSTEAHAVARVLFELASKGGTGAADVQLRELLMRQAAPIAINRTGAGMHYPIDSMAGQALGLAIGEYFIQRCQAAGGTLKPVTFDGAAYSGSQDFTGTEIFNATTGAYNAPGFYSQGVSSAVAGSSVLNWLWQQATTEL